MAWLIGNGMKTSQALQLVGDDYYFENWTNTYKKNRPLWVDKLQILENKHKLIKEYWRKKYHLTYQNWLNL